MIDWIFNSLWAAYGTYIVVTLCCVGVFLAFPNLRKYAVLGAAAAFGFIFSYQKGRNVKDREWKKKQKQAVDNLEKEYDQIDKRNTTDSHVRDRLQRGDF